MTLQIDNQNQLPITKVYHTSVDIFGQIHRLPILFGR